MMKKRCLKAASIRDPRFVASAQPATVRRNGLALWFTVFALLLCALPVLGQNEPFLVKDINEKHGSDSGAKLITELGGIAYFTAYEPETGRELWRSDGEEDGTWMVADIRPGRESSNISEILVSGSKLYFDAYDGVNGTELWVHDPATGDTDMVADIADGPGSSSPEWLTDFGGVVYFAAFTSDAGVELWKSGGNAATTKRVINLEAANGSSSPQWLTVCQNALYFRAWTSGENWSLWKSNGTETGTVPVGAPGIEPTLLTEVGGKLYFSGNDGVNGHELWLHDPTAGTTGMLKDIRSGSFGAGLKELTDFDGTLFFVAYDGVHGEELWKSDGTPGGTILVEDNTPGGPTASSYPGGLTVMNGWLYFNGQDGEHGHELWKSDGSPEGTEMVHDTVGWLGSYPSDLTASGGKLFYAALVAPEGYELWMHDPVAGTTDFVKEIHPGTTDSAGKPEELADVGGELFFTVDDGNVGRELWRSNGSVFETRIVKDINLIGGTDSDPYGMMVAGNYIYFFAFPQGTQGDPSFEDASLLRSDGTAFGTINLGECGVSDGRLEGVDANGQLFFLGGNDEYGEELWKSDGTVAGTVMVRDIHPDDGWSYPDALASIGDWVYFRATDPTNGREFWRSNGTEAGTEPVMDLNSGPGGSLPGGFVEIDGNVVFSANDGTHGRELWVHDPVADTTGPVKDIMPGSANGIDGPMVEMGGKVYFPVEEVEDHWELWVSDGTPGGTARATLGSPMWPTALRATEDTIFFFGSGAFNGAVNGPTELWKSDGTPGSLSLVKQITSSVKVIYQSYTAVSGDRFYFVFDDGVHGIELWTSDGTEAGTHIVKDIRPGNEYSHSMPSSLTPARDIAGGTDLLFFSANEGVHGYELWVTDGTEAGTRMVHDLRPGPDSSNPSYFAVMLNTLYFRANDGTHGTELWAYQFAKDSDGDGLPDDWEINGYTHPNGEYVDLPALGAKWNHKDIFIEIDHMKGTVDHEPDPDAIAVVVAAFANAPVSNLDGIDGITLHINARGPTHLKPSRTELAFQEVLGTGPDPDHYDWSEFDTLKAANFSKELEWSHHYCVFAHKLPTGDGTDSGVSRGIAANDFIVSLGAFTGGIGTEDEQAGTFMHELGHNLGLGHGGTDDVNHKPNYLSVMNYSFIHRGLIHTDPSRRWDYSREALPDLDENQLNEGTGLGGTDPNYGTKYWCNLISEWVETAAGTALAWIDWNYSGIDESDADPVKLVPADLNKDLLPLVSGTMILPGYEAEEPLRGANDWERILFEAGRIGGGMAAPPQVTEADEIDRETSDEMRPDPLGKVKGHAAKSQIILTWQPAGPKNSGIRYNVYRNGGGSAGPIGDTDRSNFHDRNVVSGTTYVYSVTWVDAQGVESAPAEVTVTAK